MSKLWRVSIVGLHLLLLSHITHSFVLLTANVEDVKKIARKFVSDSLAERITDFIAKATETLAEENTISEETKARTQVSAENRMFNVEQTINDNLDSIIKTQEETTVTPKSLNLEKERYIEVEHTTTTQSKPKKAVPKAKHGRSRYIEQLETDEITQKSTTKINVENNVTNLKEETEQTNKKRYKLLSAFDSNTTAATAGIPDNKAETTGQPLVNPKRAMDEETKQTPTDFFPYETDNAYVTEKAVNDIDQHDIAKNKDSERIINESDQYDIAKNKNTDKAANSHDQYDTERNKNTETEGASGPMSENYEDGNDINNIIPKDESRDSRFMVKGNHLTDRWWQKEFITHKQFDADVQAEGQSWF